MGGWACCINTLPRPFFSLVDILTVLTKYTKEAMLITTFTLQMQPSSLSTARRTVHYRFKLSHPICRLHVG